MSISGDFAFAGTGNCSGSVAAGASCTISVNFTPTTTGTRTGTVTIADNASNSPQTIPLTGSGVSSSGLTTVSVSPTSLTFGRVKVGHTSSAQTVTVTNTGSRTGTDIVPVYVHQPVSPVIAPRQRLVGFARVDIDPGQSKSKTVQVTFQVSQLAVTPGDIEASGRPQVETGSHQVHVEGLSAGFVVS